MNAAAMNGAGQFPGWTPSSALGLGSNGIVTVLTMMASYAYFQGQPLRMVLMGLLLQGAQYLATWLTERLQFRPMIRASFPPNDPGYDHIMCFLMDCKAWKKTNDFLVFSKTSHLKWAVKESEMQFDTLSRWSPDVKYSTNSSLAYEDNEMAEFVPRWQGSGSHLLRWEGVWIDMQQALSYNYSHHPRGPQATPVAGEISLTFYTRDASILPRFVKYVREKYKEATETSKRVIIHQPFGDGGFQAGPPGWNSVKNKPLRPLNTVSLEVGVLSNLVSEVKEFLAAEMWYTQVGIPHRRGILLHGPPGTGKTSTIYALAGDLGLEIYSISLSGPSMDDHMLAMLVSTVPKRAILLIEDIDCAFPSREELEEQEQDDPYMNPMGRMPGYPMGMPAYTMPRTNVTMSGLLNVLDGVGSDEGRLFFATTNYPERLDSALMRPGRIDLSIQYYKASSFQIRSSFHHFFPLSRYEPTSCGDEKDIGGVFTPYSQPPITLSQPLSKLAEAFVSTVPEREFTTAELQGFLLLHKWNPEKAVESIGEWVEKIREEKKALEDKRIAAKNKRKAAQAAATAAAFPGAAGLPVIPPPMPVLEQAVEGAGDDKKRESAAVTTDDTPSAEKKAAE
ncbi:P-loop containing nucleoside triphosphate hydrolase protein [Flagelloscypha sp. PMI_526]|nr:P-loop containing nucleoside triphosphate hydrolase protein [Flagelloscypha sp. PMI_526]